VLKHDHELIRDHIERLKTKYSKEARSWWPRFVFHYTNLQNAVSILDTGTLYSRHDAIRRGLMRTDNASASVVDHTADRWKRHVRLYFRPRTPTQFRNEGIRPRNLRPMDAHCPVPVFLLFDSAEILTRRETLFSGQSLARRGGAFEDSAKSFVKLPFEKIYHNTWLAGEQKDDIKACRHAEVVVPDSLDLNSLKYIWCRSQAEKSTLLHLMNTDTRRRWADKIFEGKKYDLFESRWTFVERADLSSSDMIFLFNPNTQTPGPFQLKVTVSIPGVDTPSYREDDQFMANNRLALRFRRRQERYTIQLVLDGCVAYESAFAERASVL
jgi:hypothetical protein